MQKLIRTLLKIDHKKKMKEYIIIIIIIKNEMRMCSTKFVPKLEPVEKSSSDEVVLFLQLIFIKNNPY